MYMTMSRTFNTCMYFYLFLFFSFIAREHLVELWDKFSINSSGISLYGMHAQLMAVVVWSLSMMLRSKPAFKKYCVPLLLHPFLLRISVLSRDSSTWSIPYLSNSEMNSINLAIRGVVGDGWIDYNENLQWCDNCYGKYIYVSNVY